MPSLNLAGLKQRITEHRLGPVHVLLGEDLRLVGRMVEAIEGVVDAADRPFAVERLYAGEPAGAPLQIVTAARMLPMLGDRRIVTVLRAERLLKPKRAARGAAAEAEPAEGDQESTVDAGPVDAGPLEEYLAAPVPSTTLLFVAAEIDRSRRLTKRLLDVALVTECGGLPAEAGRGDGRRGVADWLREELVRAGRTIEPEAARLLVARSGNDITKLRGDIERLLLFAEGRPRLTADDVMEVVSEDVAVEDDWAVVNAIGAGDPARALVEVGRRLDRGDSPHALVGQLRWWVSNRLAGAEAPRVRPALDALLRTDLALKSSGRDARLLLERLVVELTGRPIPAQRRWR